MTSAVVKLAGRIGEALPSGVDLHIYGGLALVAYGAWTAWPPAGPVVLGLGLFYVGHRIIWSGG